MSEESDEPVRRHQRPSFVSARMDEAILVRINELMVRMAELEKRLTALEKKPTA
jgi:hypothetical protein